MRDRTKCLGNNLTHSLHPWLSLGGGTRSILGRIMVPGTVYERVKHSDPFLQFGWNTVTWLLGKHNNDAGTHVLRKQFSSKYFLKCCVRRHHSRALLEMYCKCPFCFFCLVMENGYRLTPTELYISFLNVALFLTIAPKIGNATFDQTLFIRIRIETSPILKTVPPAIKSSVKFTPKFSGIVSSHRYEGVFSGQRIFSPGDESALSKIALSEETGSLHSGGFIFANENEFPFPIRKALTLSSAFWTLMHSHKFIGLWKTPHHHPPSFPLIPT